MVDGVEDAAEEEGRSVGEDDGDEGEGEVEAVWFGSWGVTRESEGGRW